jgi:hypothetical protein
MANYKILEVNEASSTARFEINAQNGRSCQFSIPKEVCDLLGISPQDGILIEVSSARGVTQSNPTNLKSGREIYGSGLKDACSPGERIRVRVTKVWSITGVGESPEVADAIAAIESVSNPRRKFGRRFTAAENAAIEERAVVVTKEYFENELGYETKDVGAKLSYDVHATRGQEVVKVEVKGTTTDGAAVVLTRNEVNRHRAEHPQNALAVVRNITLDRTGDQLIATGGDLVLVKPWKINEDGLSPIAYDYRTGI